MSIDLPEEFANFVEQEVASGRFESATDVICHSLKLLREREQRLEELRRELQIGIDQIERGEYVEISTPEELDEFFADIERRAERPVIDDGRI